VDYAPALPTSDKVQDVVALVKAQEKAAITAYAYHLSGLGWEHWDHTRPAEEDDDCIKSIWKMVCYTYFPKAQKGCKTGQATNYLRPCHSSCKNYVKACQVECCDESVQCTFQHDKPINKTSVLQTKGYVARDGPCPFCTGASVRAQRMSAWLAPVLLLVHLLFHSRCPQVHVTTRGLRQLAFFGCLVLVVITMQGCDAEHELDVPSHMTGNWRQQPDYLMEYEYIPPGSPPSKAKLNSCHVPNIPLAQQCSGRGICRSFDPTSRHPPARFCECNRDWADPECRTKRKSQVNAYLLSLFGGLLGADQFYLGYGGLGAMKLCTLGGLGVWWIIDIIRIGSAPVYSAQYRVAHDLPHWVFTISLLAFMLTLSFICVGYYTLAQVAQRRKDVLMLQAKEQERQWLEHINPRSDKGFAQWG